MRRDPSSGCRTSFSRSTGKAESPEPPALYVHIPFCVVKCGYCDFHSLRGVPGQEIDAVLNATLEELEALDPRPRPRSIFLGGGTPTHLSESQLARFLAELRARVDCSSIEEFSAEANPESASAAKLEILRDAGVKRLSLGIQSFDRERLRFLDRPHDGEQALRAYRRVRRLPDVQVSLDLIYALPGQTLEDWLVEMDRAIELEPEHISCYQLTFEPGTPLHAALRRGSVQEAPAELGREMLLRTRQRLGAAGYPAYEISNFARPGAECRHNLNYWRAGDYQGLGPGAASHLAGRRSTNCRPLGSYVRLVEETGSASWAAETLSPERRSGEAIWLGLRMSEGAELECIERRTGVAAGTRFAPTIERYCEQGVCELRGSRLLLTEAGVPYADQVGSGFL